MFWLDTLLKFNCQLPLKNGGWKEGDPASYWVSATFQGQTVKISGGYLVLEKTIAGFQGDYFFVRNI